MKNKTIYLTIFMTILIASAFVGAVTLTSKDIYLEKVQKDYLETKGIGEIEVYNTSCKTYNKDGFECIETDNSLLGYDYPKRSGCYDDGDLYICKLYQKGGINKDVSIVHTSCLQYGWIEGTEECIFDEEMKELNCETIGGYNTTECVNLKVLSDKEKDDAIDLEVKKVIENIYDVYKGRESNDKIVISNEKEYIIKEVKDTVGVIDEKS